MVIGLESTRKRLAWLFKSEARLEFLSDSGRATTRIVLPLLYSNNVAAGPSNANAAALSTASTSSLTERRAG
jgi:hypothetical protein